MKTPASTVTRGLIVGAISSVMGSGFAPASSAADLTGTHQITVSFTDLDASTVPGASILYRRIRSAAETVCSPVSHGDLSSRMNWNICVHRAIGNGVARVNQPALSAVYVDNYPADRPVDMVVAQKR